MRIKLMAVILFSELFCFAAGTWSHVPGLKVSGTLPRSRFVWNGTELCERTNLSDGTPVVPGQLLQAELSIRYSSARPGFLLEPGVRFLDKHGAELSCGTVGTPLPRPRDADVVDYEEFITVPDNAVQAQWSFLFYGNAAELEIIRAKLTPGAVRPSSESMHYPQWKNPDALDDQALDEHLKKLAVSHARVVRHGEYNSLEVNGREINPAIYYTTGYNHIPNMRFNMAGAYSKAGVKIFSVPFQLGCGRPAHTPQDIWQGPGKYELKELRAELRKLLREAPDAKIMLHIEISPYRGYGTAHPDELYRSEDGKFGGLFHGYMRLTSDKVLELKPGEDGMYSPPSYYSRHFNDAAARALTDLAREISAMPEGKAVIGAYLNGGVDGQWFDLFNSAITLTADYSPASRSAFEQYLHMKYGNDRAALRRSWRDPEADFSTAKIPSHAELWRTDRNFHTIFQTASRLSDYCDFAGYGLAQRQIQWCDAIKKGSQNRWIAGSYYSNSGLRGYPQLGLQSVRYLLNAPSMDFLVIIPNYLRSCQDAVHLGGFDGSLVRHGKLIVTELDLRTGELPYWGYWGTPFWRKHTPAERFAVDARRFAAAAIEKGGTFHMYDMEGGCFNSPAALKAWSEAAALFAERTPCPVTRKHIGIVASERFWSFQSFGAGRITVYDVRETPLYALYRTGVRHAAYLLEDVLSPDFDAPQVLIFLDAGTMTREQARTIRSRFADSGRVLVWVWGPGMFTDGDEQNPGRISNFRLERAPAADDTPLFVDGSISDPLLNRVSGFLFPHTPAYRHSWGMAWRIADPQAKVLGHYFKTGIPGMAVKRYARHTEVYLGAPGSLTPQLCRNLAQEAGVPVFLDSDDFCGTGAGLLYVSAVRTGRKNISLPDGFSGCTALTGQQFTLKDRQLTLTMSAGELLILKLQK
ncbi:MAG: hypothetical protein MR727_00695 [Lentisphaeria bacterium]|nr:hypothetical protein [Lentisphaeria bacterium]